MIELNDGFIAILSDEDTNKEIAIDDLRNIIEKLEELYCGEFFVLGAKENLENENIKNMIEEVNKKCNFIKLTPLNSEVRDGLLYNRNTLYLIKNEIPIKLYFK